ncbi:hypothetical protein [Streptosporangium carneum]|uniref:hypothetical protein n=1 Tax=Streptosporangium carneum TaxID=47481 RepID=UPI0022F2FF60|nr:hypothetical protein [Streptosporangium carneum]
MNNTLEAPTGRPPIAAPAAATAVRAQATTTRTRTLFPMALSSELPKCRDPASWLTVVVSR